MNDDVEIVTVDASSVAQYGFFCYKSKRKSEGYRRRLDWLKQRFSEGMKIKIVYEDKRSVNKLNDAPDPAFPTDWGERLGRCASGLTVFRSDQCPYIDNGVKAVLEAASDLGIPARVVEITNCQQAQDLSPSSYGVYGVVHNGKLLTYHNVGKKDVLQRLSAR